MTEPTEDRPEGQKIVFPPVTPEGLFHQDQLKMKWDARERAILREISNSRARFPKLWEGRDQVFEQTSSPMTSRGDEA